MASRTVTRLSWIVRSLISLSKTPSAFAILSKKGAHSDQVTCQPTGEREILRGAALYALCTTPGTLGIKKMQFTIAYRITGLGWSECVVSAETQSCTVTASYLSDALGQLILAASAVASLFGRVTFSFEKNPGGCRWVITSPRMNEIQVEILDFQQS